MFKAGRGDGLYERFDLSSVEVNDVPAHQYFKAAEAELTRFVERLLVCPVILDHAVTRNHHAKAVVTASAVDEYRPTLRVLKDS